MNQCPYCEEEIPVDTLKCYDCGASLLSNARKKRSPFSASLLSLIMPGLGQVYNGQAIKGIIYHFIGYLFILLISFTEWQFNYSGLITILIISLCYYFAVIVDAFGVAIKQKFLTLKKYNKWYIYLLIIILASALSMVTDGPIKRDMLRVRAYSIPAGSMMPSLLIGDHKLVDLRNNSTPQRGDMIVFDFPKDTSKGFIKRVLGVGGDTIEIKNKKVYLNNKLINEPYIIHRDSAIEKTVRDNFGPFVVPQDSFFVLGDNRDQSYDSRFWGVVNKQHIKGKALYIYFSLDEENLKVRWDRIGQTIK